MRYRYEVVEAKDLLNELEELQAEIDALEETLEDENEKLDNVRADINYEIDRIKNDKRYLELVAVEDELRDMARDRDNLIDVDDFKNYLMENYNDMYDPIPDNLVMYIDWDKLADDISSDFTQIDIGNDTYYVI